MTWEKTVISDKALLKFELKYTRDDTFYWGAAFDAALKHQTELTGDIAFKAGIQKVVEFIKENRETPLGTDAYGYYVWEAALQAKLKEWGIK